MKKIKKTERPPFALNIAKRRKAKNLNQEEFAELVGLHINTIKDLERGLSEGGPDTRQAIASALKCQVWELFKPESAESENSKEHDERAELVGKVVSRLTSINEDYLKMILAAIDAGTIPPEVLQGKVTYSLEEFKNLPPKLKLLKALDDIKNPRVYDILIFMAAEAPEFFTGVINIIQDGHYPDLSKDALKGLKESMGKPAPASSKNKQA